MSETQTINASDFSAAEDLISRGFCWLERTLKVEIQLGNKDFKKFCRMKIETVEDISRVKEIAENNFLRDIRFLTLPYDEIAIKKNIYEYIDNRRGQIYGCFFKEILAGFIEVVEDSKVGTIRLAAVDEKYRMTGAALSLYAGAAMKYQAADFTALVGRISTRNMPVMNLYATLGAKFSLPIDVYGKVEQNA